MEPVTCFSSQLMTELSVWRNLQGKDENWMYLPQNANDNSLNRKITVAAAEMGYALLAVIAVVESAVYFFMFAACMRAGNDQLLSYFWKKLDSSEFTFLWAISSLSRNLFNQNIMTKEWMERFNFVDFRRLDDCYETFIWHLNLYNDRRNIPYSAVNATSLYHITRMLANLTQSLFQNVTFLSFDGMQDHVTQEKQRYIEQGAQFLSEHIFSGLQPDALQAAKEGDPGIFLYTLSKSIHMYGAGSKRNEALPGFFQPQTIEGLRNFRSNVLEEAVVHELENALSSLSAFEKGPEDPQAKQAFDELRAIASKEMQGGFFVSQCFQKAIGLLD